MNQTLHIFRKDTRQHWIEILAFLVALSLYAFCYPSRWNYSEFAMRSQYLNLLLPQTLVPAAAWLLIVRVIQAESLVGDRQWWLTRPYERKKLFAAKVLFLAVWLYVPFIIAEAAILKEGSLSPLAHLAGWLPLLAIASAYGVLPLTALAALTSNFVRMTLALFGAIIVWLAATALTSMPRGGYESNVPFDRGMWIVFVVIAGAVAAILIQFATRRVSLARGVAVATIVLATAAGLLVTATRQGEIDRAYRSPNPSAAPPMQLALATNGHVSWGGVLHVYPSERPDKIYITVPATVSGIVDGSAVQVDDVKVALDGPATGQQWTAPWWASRTLRFLPGQHQSNIQIMLDRDQYDRFKTAPATLRLTLAVTELRASGETTAALSTGDFTVSGFGVCTGRWLYRFPAQPMCRFSALGPPPLAYVSTMWSRTGESGAYVPPGPITGESWADTGYGSELFLRLLPVLPARTVLYPRSIYGELHSTDGLELTPGTPIHFTQYSIVGRTQVSLTIPNFQLPNEPR